MEYLVYSGSTPENIAIAATSLYDRHCTQYLSISGSDSESQALLEPKRGFHFNQWSFAANNDKANPGLRSSILVLSLIVNMVLRYKHEKTPSFIAIITDALPGQRYPAI